MINPLLQLGDQGQSIWLDYLHQKILQNGELKRLIENDGLKGLTSNPSIFEKAIGAGNDYDARLETLLEASDGGPMALYERLAIGDIQTAADQFRPVYDRLNGEDGYVSLEVSPYLAMDTGATIAEARRLWAAVDRPNLMIKVPGTKAGAPAIRQLIGEGINVNVTLLFSIDAYLEVAEAYLAGLEALQSKAGDIAKTHSVASFFLSRIDVAIDKRIDARRAEDGDRTFDAVRGKVAIASAKVAYQHYLSTIATSRWSKLAAAGATPQRLLWASTGTKDPAFSDILYVAELIGRDTITTLPPKTMEAFRDHGEVAPSLTQGVDEARAVLAEVERLGLNLSGVADDLLAEGVQLFAQAFDRLFAAVANKRARMLGDKLNGQSIAAPAPLLRAQQDVIEHARSNAWPRRLWDKDASLWTGADEAKWLGWLGAGCGEDVDTAALAALQRHVKAGAFTHALLLGMGGSSLGPEVIANTLSPRAAFPKLLILDSTDPAQIARVESEIDLTRTLFIVSSKSGSTLEPNILFDYFFARAKQAMGDDKPGAHFIAVTDQHSPLDERARRDGFWRTLYGNPEIGGRYSVLSNFGMAPAAIIGHDVNAFLARVRPMVRACGADAPPDANPGFLLGALLGVAALAGRDKVTIVASPEIADFGTWLEQLLAESTGKHGKGLIPVNDEPLGAPEVYGADRVFVSLQLQNLIDQTRVFFSLQSESQAEQRRTAALDALERTGHPVVRITLASAEMLGQEFFRWQVAVAVAGAVMQLNPFDQPDVEASKAKTVALTDGFEKTGKVQVDTPLAQSDGLALYADPRNAKALAQAADSATFDALLSAHLKRAHAGDYIGLLAYLDRDQPHRDAIRRLRQRIRDKLKVATVVGFGPRYLHSTGQAYKGGPNSGVFLQITADAGAELPIPGRKASFSIVEAAQARGDFDVLADRGRRALRLHLGKNIEGGLKRLADVVERSLD